MTKMKNEVVFTDILGDKLFDCDYFLYYDMNRYGNPTIRYGQVDEVEDKYKFRMSDFFTRHGYGLSMTKHSIVSSRTLKISKEELDEIKNSYNTTQTILYRKYLLCSSRFKNFRYLDLFKIDEVKAEIIKRRSFQELRYKQELKGVKFKFKGEYIISGTEKYKIKTCFTSDSTSIIPIPEILFNRIIEKITKELTITFNKLKLNEIVDSF